MRWQTLTGSHWPATEDGRWIQPYTIDDLSDPNLSNPLYMHYNKYALDRQPEGRPVLITREKDDTFAVFCATLDEAKAIVLLLL